MGFRKAASPRTKRASEPSASCWRHSTPVTCFLKGKCTIVTHKGAHGLPRGSSGTRESLTLPLVPTVRSGPRARASPAPKPQSSWPLGTPLSSWMFQRKVRGHCRVTDAQMLTLEAVPTGSPHLSLPKSPAGSPSSCPSARLGVRTRLPALLERMAHLEDGAGQEMVTHPVTHLELPACSGHPETRLPPPSRGSSGLSCTRPLLRLLLGSLAPQLGLPEALPSRVLEVPPGQSPNSHP